MTWSAYLVVAVLAAGLGFAGAQVALTRHRERTPRDEPVGDVDQALFALSHHEGQTWVLTNIGTAEARVVKVVPLVDGVEHWPPRPAPGGVTTATSDLLPTLQPGGSTSIWFSQHHPRQQVLVSWTSVTNVRMGPVVLDVPAP